MTVNNVQIDPQVFATVVSLVRNAVGSVVKPTGVQMRGGGGVQSPAEMAAAAARDAAVLSEKERREMEGDKPAAPKMEQDPEKLKAAAQKYLDKIKKAADKLKAKNAKLKARGLPELPGNVGANADAIEAGFSSLAADVEKQVMDAVDDSGGASILGKYELAEVLDKSAASVQQNYDKMFTSFKSEAVKKFGVGVVENPEFKAAAAEFSKRGEAMRQHYSDAFRGWLAPETEGIPPEQMEYKFGSANILDIAKKHGPGQANSWGGGMFYRMPRENIAKMVTDISATKDLAAGSADSAKNYLAQVYAKLSVKPQKVKVPKAVKK